MPIRMAAPTDQTDKSACAGRRQSLWVTSYRRQIMSRRDSLFENTHSPERLPAANRPHFPQTLDGQAVSRLPRFIFYSQTEKLSRRFRVLVCNRHRLAPPRREHIVGSTFVWFPYGHACLNASGACYRRGGSAHYCSYYVVTAYRRDSPKIRPSPLICNSRQTLRYCSKSRIVLFSK